MGPRQVHGTMQRHDRLACAGRSRDARRPVIVAHDELPLLGMQEDRPLVPRGIEGALQLLDARHHPEAPLRIWMLERVGYRHRLRRPWRASGGELKDRLRRLRGQMLREGEQAVLVCLPDVARTTR